MKDFNLTERQHVAIIFQVWKIAINFTIGMKIIKLLIKFHHSKFCIHTLVETWEWPNSGLDGLISDFTVKCVRGVCMYFTIG